MMPAPVFNEVKAGGFYGARPPALLDTLRKDGWPSG